MLMNPRALLIFAKGPKPGRAKTRLTPPCSPEEAAALSQCFIRDALKAASMVQDVERYLFFSPEESRPFFEKEAPEGYTLVLQHGKNLTERCAHSIKEAWDRRHSRIVQIGTDTPQIRVQDIEQAFGLLEEYDMGLGPAEDGGYYLLSLARPALEIYDRVVMGRDTVFEKMLANAERLGLSVKVLPKWIDVDTFRDLLCLQRDPAVMLGEHTRKYLASRAARQAAP